MDPCLNGSNVFLTDRTQRVVVHGESSLPSYMTSGVPQGMYWVRFYFYVVLMVLLMVYHPQ